YNTSPITEVNVTGVTGLGGVQDAIKAKFSHTLPMAASEIQLHDTDNNPITDFDDIRERYFEKIKIGKNGKNGGLTLTIQPMPTPEASILSVVADTVPAFTQQDIDGELVPEITADLKAFKDAQIVDGCIVSPSQAFLPYSPEKLKKLYVRLCYEDVFDLLVEGVEDGLKFFAITGTPGIGKTPFFIYLLYRLMKSRSVGNLQSSPRLLNATRIVFQTSEIYQCFDLVKQDVFHVEDVEAAKLVRESNTLYIITATDIPVIPSSCVTLFIASPVSEEYQQFVNKARILKGIALETAVALRWHSTIHLPIGSLVTHDDLEAALADKHAANRIRNVALDREMNGNVHMLMHMVVSEDGQYRHIKGTMASKKITERLFDYYPEQMLFILQEELRRDEIRMRFASLFGNAERAWKR
ncbi:hypothetical protein HDU77_007528, partial [Chytriomyces hyalinus]